MENLARELTDNFDVILKSKQEKPKSAETKKPKSKSGQIYRLGNHRLIIGDCTDKKTVEGLLGDAFVSCLMTDPPYGTDIKGKMKRMQKYKGEEIKDKGIEHDIIVADYVSFFSSFLELIRFSKKNAVYIWMTGQRLCEVLQACEKSDVKISQHIVWVKNNFVLSMLDHKPMHETVLYGWHGDGHVWYGKKGQVSVFQNPINLVNEWHPTQKPLKVIHDMISNSTKKGDVVYDPFCGGGTTLIACEQSERKCYAIELDPKFADATITRWEQLTKKKAELIK